MINVLDKGYVRLVDHMGSDLSIVNAARVSYAKESTWDTEEVIGSPDFPSQVGTPYDIRTVSYKETLREKDKRLIQFLVREGHLSPFRHAMATFEVKAPLMVARQWL